MSIGAPEKHKSSGMTPQQPSQPPHKHHRGKHHGHRWYHPRRHHSIIAGALGLAATIVANLQTIMNALHWLLEPTFRTPL
jgi:hypothetical protein